MISFTFGSNVYQIGVMMDKLLKGRSQDIPSDVVGLLQMLQNKVAANEALQHAWLADMRAACYVSMRVPLGGTASFVFP